MKAQVSIETTMAVGVILLLMVFVLVTAVTQDLQKDVFEQSYAERNVCNKLSLTISTFYSQGPSQRMTFYLEEDAEISDSMIKVGNNYCSFVGDTTSVNLTRGNVEIKNLDGTVVLANV